MFHLWTSELIFDAVNFILYVAVIQAESYLTKMMKSENFLIIQGLSMNQFSKYLDILA